MRPFAFAVSTTSGGGGGGGGGGGTTPAVAFSQPGGDYPVTTITVTLTVSGTNVTMLRWKLNNGAYTSVNALSTSITVHPVIQGAIISCDALSSVGGILASGSQTYTYASGGGV